jgi:hypothetical protein
MKITAGKPKLAAKIRKEVSAGVEAALEDSSLSYTSFLVKTCVKRKSLYRAFRSKMRNARLWDKTLALLAEARFDELLDSEIKRQQRAAPRSAGKEPGAKEQRAK